MTSQSEQILEQNLISQLTSNGYDRVVLKDEPALLRNLKTQLEKHNNKTFSETDFSQILNHLTKTNNVFEKAKVLRDKFSFRNDKNEVTYVEFINMEHWCQNQYQVKIARTCSPCHMSLTRIKEREHNNSRKTQQLKINNIINDNGIRNTDYSKKSN